MSSSESYADVDLKDEWHVSWTEYPHIPEMREGVWWHCFGSVVLLSGGVALASVIFEPWYECRKTPKGVWVASTDYDAPPMLQKFVLDCAENEWGRRFAYRDPQKALHSFRKRLQHRRLYWNREGERIKALEEVLQDG